MQILMNLQANDKQIFWLQTVFQNTIEVALQLSHQQAPEQTPFVHKYQAINLLKSLVEVEHSYKFIVQTLLGQIYNEVQQINDSLKSYQAALIDVTKINPQNVHQYFQYFILIYNNLGLSFLNRDENQQGFGCLAKSCQIYQAFKDYPGENVYHNRSFTGNGRSFRYFYEGGNDHQQVQDAYTLTLFYLAQAYTKMQYKDQAAQSCGLTLKRQHTTGKYELKEFVNNLTGLSEYYQGNKYFAQAQYLLMLALKVIPEGRKKKLRATVQISIGNLLCQLLEFSCNRLEQKDIGKEDNKIVSKQILLFQEFDQPFPQIALPDDIQGCKSLFRQANTQFKKSLQVFVLDGYVTEHIQTLFSQSRLYKSLAILQKSAERKMSMLQKRREMLEPLLKQLNPKAYPATWQKLLVEVSEVVNDLFNLKVTNLGAKGFPSEQKIKASCELGKKSIGFFKQIIQCLLQDKDTPRHEQYYRSIINSKINIAKGTSKLMSSDRKQRVEYLKESLGGYQSIIDYIKKDLPEDLRCKFQKELELTKEMIAMMPNKIDKVNYGQLNYLD